MKKILTVLFLAFFASCNVDTESTTDTLVSTDSTLVDTVTVVDTTVVDTTAN